MPLAMAPSMTLDNRLRSMLVAGLLFTTACGYGGAASYGGDYGATPGGVKDMRLARALIAAGRVPPPEALLVEGMFAEHDLGLSGPGCQRPLCLRAAAGVAPDLEEQPHGWLQVGMSSAIDPDAFTAPPTTYIYTVDVSGSMGWEYDGGDYPSPGNLARDLLHRLAAELRPEDQVAIVTYGSDVDVPLGFTNGGSDTVHGVIDGLGTDGSTDMEAGLRRAYELGRAARAAGNTSQVRIVLFTDVQPNVGATEPTEFQQMVSDGAGDGLAITVVALGLGIGPEVLQAMAHLRGANAFSLTRTEDVDRFIAEEGPLFATPIAYDLELHVRAPDGLDVDAAYGFPTGPDGALELTVSSVFLSRRRGAVLVSLAGDETALAAFAAEADLRYTTPGGDQLSEAIPVSRDGAPLDERGQWFGQPSVAATTALALLVTAMHDAADLYDSDRAAAAALMRAAHARFAADAAALGGDLSGEVDLAAAMLTLIEAGAPQGTLYDEL
jgi:Ca-activated chloride channel homolog